MTNILHRYNIILSDITIDNKYFINLMYTITTITM